MVLNVESGTPLDPGGVDQNVSTIDARRGASSPRGSLASCHGRELVRGCGRGPGRGRGVAVRRGGGGLHPGAQPAAKEAKAAGDKDLAAAITRLKKPSVAAWAVNLLVRRESDQIDSVLALAEQLRSAAEALDGDELRALTRQRRQLTGALATSARSLAREAGVRLTEPVVDQVEGVLTAAMLDPVAAQVVRTGRVVTAFTSTGVSELDVDAVVAVPEALDVQATAIEDAGRRGRPASSCTSCPTTGPSSLPPRTRSRRRPATSRRPRASSTRSRTSIEQLNARRLQLQGEADELRRRLAAIEDDVDQVDDDLEEAEERAGRRPRRARRGRAVRAAAEQALAKLQG